MKLNSLFITVLFLIFTILIPEPLAQDIMSTILGEHEEDVNSVAFSPDGQTLASGSDDETVVLWDVARGEQTAILRGHEGTVYSVAFSPDGRTLASGSDDETVVLWDVARGEQTAILRGHEGTVYSVAFSPDGRTLASGSKDNTVILWDAARGWRKTILEEHGDWVYSVAFSPDGQTLASGSGDGTVILWDVKRKRKKTTFKVGETRVHSVAFSPDGQTLASGHWHRTVFLWDIAREERKTTLIGHPLRAVHSVAFSPDGRILASGSSNGTMILWDVVSGKQKATLLGHDGKVNSIVFDLDGSKLASGSKDGTIRLWDTNATASPDIVFESQEIDDGFKGFFGWSTGNANGVVEIGESITFIVTLRNRGEVEAKNVKGILSTKDKLIKNIIVDREVDYGNIGSDKISPVHPIGRPLFSDIPQVFKFKIPFILTSTNAAFTLTVTADNGGPWSIPITVPIINRSDTPIIKHANIGIELPDDMISEVAFGPDSTYFVLTAQFPMLTGVSESEVTYKDCTITLDLEGVPDNSLSARFLPAVVEYIRQVSQPFSILTLAGILGILDDPFGAFPDEPQYYMFPLQTAEERLREVEIDSDIGTLISAVGLIPAFGDAASVLGITISELKRIQGIDEILKSTMDPKIHLTNYDYLRTGRPDDELRYVVLLPKRGQSIKIKVEQKYQIKNDPDAIEHGETWNLESETFAAPHAQLMSLSEYPSFRLLPSEIQKYLLLEFSLSVTAGISQIPSETSLLANYPNPFNPETWIPYQLAEAAGVTLTIYDIKGRVVRDLDLGHQRAGMYHARSRAVYWDGKNTQGESVASGVYFYTLKAGEFTTTRKMLIRK